MNMFYISVKIIFTEIFTDYLRFPIICLKATPHKDPATDAPSDFPLRESKNRREYFLCDSERFVNYNGKMPGKCRRAGTRRRCLKVNRMSPDKFVGSVISADS